MPAFDRLMPPEAQHQWLQNPPPARKLSGARPDSHLRRTIHLIEHPWGETIMDVLRAYVWQGIPIPLASEMEYWTCSCFPGQSLSGEVDFARININWQEVFTAYQRDERLTFSLYSARSPLIETFGDDLAGLRRAFPAIDELSAGLKPGGLDQVHIRTHAPATIHALLAHRDVLAGVRLFSLRLMRRGPCPFARYHNFFLADHLLQPPASVA